MKDFVFISYSHADSKRVVPILDALSRRDFTLWYDKGIRTGEEWPSVVEDNLLGAGCVMVFVSESLVESVNCRNEINLAVAEKKDVLVIYLDDTELKHGLKLQIGTRQSLFAFRFESIEALVKEILNTDLVKRYIKPPVVDIGPKNDAPKQPRADLPRNDFDGAMASLREALTAFKQNPQGEALDAVFAAFEALKTAIGKLSELSRKRCLAHTKKIELFLQALKLQLSHMKGSSPTYLASFVDTYLLQLTPELDAMAAQ